MMVRGYRAVLELKQGDALETADRVFHSWVNEKYGRRAGGRDIDWNGEGIYRLGERHDKHGDAASLYYASSAKTRTMRANSWSW